MQDRPQLRTARLLLRRWRSQDSDPFAALNADPVVMEHFPATLSHAESDALIERIETCFAENGFGAWAVEIPDRVPLIGFVGLWPVPAPMPFAPAVEIGWRLAAAHWGAGLAHEAATASIDYAFGELGLGSLVSYTTPANTRSWGLMERLGMDRDAAEDFAHPDLPAGHPQAGHVLYRIDARAWAERSG